MFSALITVLTHSKMLAGTICSSSFVQKCFQQVAAAAGDVSLESDEQCAAAEELVVELVNFVYI